MELSEVKSFMKEGPIKLLSPECFVSMRAPSLPEIEPAKVLHSLPLPPPEEH